ncbi:hypothetical protein TNCV_4402041 [Trichonephila clavipes]|nr:hypothetical protein TNCV_4402041 [Trichonephila clavipes]
MTPSLAAVKFPNLSTPPHPQRKGVWAPGQITVCNAPFTLQVFSSTVGSKLRTTPGIACPVVPLKTFVA